MAKLARSKVAQGLPMGRRPMLTVEGLAARSAESATSVAREIGVSTPEVKRARG